MDDPTESIATDYAETPKHSLTHDPFKEKGRVFVDLPYDFVTRSPDKHVGDIMLSKAIVKSVKKITGSCFTPLESNTRMHLSALQIQLYNTEKKLANTRKKMAVKRQGMKQQWKDLEDKEDELKNNFIDFNKFVRENFEKRYRAQKKLSEDKALITKRQNDIDSYLKEITEIKTIRERMVAIIKRYRVFQDYLQSIVIESSEFKAINEILGRYTALIEAKDLLLKDQKRNMLILENARNDMMKLIEEKNFVIMGLNNQIANLQARYENANIKALESEELVTEIKNNAVKQLGEIDTVKNAIWNVYVHMATSKKHPIKIKKDNVEEQMMYINRTLTELSKVNKIIKKKSSKTK